MYVSHKCDTILKKEINRLFNPVRFILLLCKFFRFNHKRSNVTTKKQLFIVFFPQWMVCNHGKGTYNSLNSNYKFLLLTLKIGPKKCNDPVGWHHFVNILVPLAGCNPAATTMLLVWLNILHRFLCICQRVWPRTTRTRTTSTSVQRVHCITICQGSLCLGAICAAVTLKSEINCSCTLAQSVAGLCEVHRAANLPVFTNHW